MQNEDNSVPILQTRELHIREETCPKMTLTSIRVRI